MKKNKRYWISLNPETKKVFYDTLNGELDEARMLSMDITKTFPMIRLTLEMPAKDIRMASILKPGILNPEDFDLYKNKGIHVVVVVQYGDIISAYQELY